MKSLKTNLEKLLPLRTLRYCQSDFKSVSKSITTKKYNLINTHSYYMTQSKLLKKLFKPSMDLIL